jgi:glycosyltransferase involved in cell wall biosynthesis
VHATLFEARKLGLPVILRPCGQLHRYSLGRSWLYKRAYLSMCGSGIKKACLAWHFTSENEARESWPWKVSNYFVLPNGVDAESLAVSREAARLSVNKRLPELDDCPYVLFLGRLHPKKRLDLLLDAFLSGAPEPYKLLVVGPDESGLWEPLRARFLAHAAQSRRVIRVGPVGGGQKIELFAGAALFALPSEHENFGIAPLEALAAGTPVLLSPQVDIATSVAKAGLGKVAPLTVCSWRERFRFLEAPRVEQPAFVARARQWVAANHGWRELTRQVLDHYRIVRSAERELAPQGKLNHCVFTSTDRQEAGDSLLPDGRGW